MTKEPANTIELIPAGTDHFAVLGLPRLLNLDARALGRAFHDLNRRYHPDRFATADPRERRISLENSARVNNAHKTLKDPWRRAQYLVEIESEASANGSRPPMDLFEEILELQELMLETRDVVHDETIPEALCNRLNEAAEPFRGRIDSAVARRDSLFTAIDAAEGADRADLVSRLAELLDERRYLARVIADVDAALEGRDSERDSL